MSKRIPISDLKALAKKHNLTHVVLYGYDSEASRLHLITYGKTIEQCGQAADAGNTLKKVLSLPESFYQQPSRVKKLQNQIVKLKNQIHSMQTDSDLIPSPVDDKFNIPPVHDND